MRFKYQLSLYISEYYVLIKLKLHLKMLLTNVLKSWMFLEFY